MRFGELTVLRQVQTISFQSVLNLCHINELRIITIDRSTPVSDNNMTEKDTLTSPLNPNEALAKSPGRGA
jgi:hypothetical protein